MPTHFPSTEHTETLRLAPAFRDYPSRLFIETSSRCNMSCLVCVKQNPDNISSHGDMDLATFETLKEVFPRLDALVLNGTGEPLLNQHLEMFISQAKKNMSSQGWIGFQTNGYLLSNLRALALVDAGLDRICLTMDDVSLSAFGATRTGGQWLDLEPAFSAIASSKAICSRPELQVGVEFVVTSDNLPELPAAINWAAARGATFAIVSDLNPHSETASNQYPAAGSDEASSLFHAWKGKADNAGVNIDRYFELLWKHDRTPEEQRIVNFVESMRSIARYRDVQLSQNHPVIPEISSSQVADQAFERVRRIARETGVDLMFPHADRFIRGDSGYIEQTAAFISWDGEMYSGDHFRNRCRSCASGWPRPVQTAVFGNVLKSGVLDIWNSVEFRSYRRKTLQQNKRRSSGSGGSDSDPAHNSRIHTAVRGAADSEPCGGCRRSSGVFHYME